MSKGDEPRALYPIIPTSSLKTLLKALKEKSIHYPKPLKLSFVASKKDDPAKTNLLLDAGDVRFCTKLVEARSPQWKHIVAGAGGMPCATVESGQLLSAIKNAGIVASTAYSGMNLTFERNKLTVSGKKKDGISAELTVPMTYSGKKVKIELNRDCFTAMLQAMNGNICIYAPTELGGVLKVDVNDGKFVYVIMCMK
jgi:DNA polymerase III sliding clamp (beta) subunit (PCNA family)